MEGLFLAYIDLHCDSLLKIFNKYDGEKLYDNKNLSVDFKGLKETNAIAQFFAIFLPDQTTLDQYNLKNISDDLYIKK